MNRMKNLILSDKPKRLAETVVEKSKLLKSQPGGLPVYKVPLTEEHIGIPGCRRFIFGKEKSSKRNRTIMVLGATGAGKSTLLNGMINYILDVKWEDNYRFKLVDEGDITASQAHSQTSEVTVYKLNYHDEFKCLYSLTIVDTPGFGDTRGIDRDREITEQLRNLFNYDLGVVEIDAVCFVAQAALARLTPTQQYVFDSVLSIFGNDVAENIRILATFADGQRPPVLEAISAAGVPCPKTKQGVPIHFKFNNSALFAQNSSANTGDGEDDDDEVDESFDQMFWDMGIKSMDRFFGALNSIKTQSLTLTKEVLKERQRLEISIENLQMQVIVGISKLEKIKSITETLEANEAEIKRNKDFKVPYTYIKSFQTSISGSGNYITNCQVCMTTCHYPCGIPNDDGKKDCDAMGSDGRCKQCPGKCNWNCHFNQKYKWEYKYVTEEKTVEELQQNYLKATKEKVPIQALIEQLKAEYDDVQTQVVEFMETSAKCLNRLKEIALKPNPLSTPKYIDMLIEGEKSEAKPGYTKRIKSLMAMKQKAEYMAKVEQGKKLLPRSNSECEAFQE
ncbi:uncharacterized protein LOC134099233 [Sardina pilchardus]|uniref:uncharacterized protein LOC134099233 n=1 Tax=Sardina pilchardus TaxID=27697 RepID=UPI002E1332E7